MNREMDDFYEDKEADEAIERFEDMLESGGVLYFDVCQIEYIVDCYLDNDDMEKAFKAVEIGLSQHPEAITLLVKKAGILLNMGEVNTAQTMADRLLRIEDTNVELFIIKGTALLFKNKTREAAEAFDIAVEYTIEDKDETLFSIGFAYEQSDNINEALRYFEEAYHINPENEGVLYELGYCYEKINEDKKSIKFYDLYLDVDTFSDTAWFNIGVVYSKLKMFEKAIEAYEYALALNDKFENAWFNIGYTYCTWKKYKKAIVAFEEYSKLNEDDDEVYCLIAECNLKMHRNRKAYGYYEKALEKNAFNANACYGMGFILNSDGNFAKADEFLKKSVKLEPDNGEYWFTYAQNSSKLNHYHDAILGFETAARIIPENSGVWLSHAALLSKRGLVYKAIDLLYEALEHLPENIALNYQLSAYLLEVGDEAGATNVFEKAHSLDCGN